MPSLSSQPTSPIHAALPQKPLQVFSRQPDCPSSIDGYRLINTIRGKHILSGVNPGLLRVSAHGGTLLTPFDGSSAVAGNINIGAGRVVSGSLLIDTEQGHKLITLVGAAQSRPKKVDLQIFDIDCSGNVTDTSDSIRLDLFFDFSGISRDADYPIQLVKAAGNSLFAFSPETLVFIEFNRDFSEIFRLSSIVTAGGIIGAKTRLDPETQKTILYYGTPGSIFCIAQQADGTIESVPFLKVPNFTGSFDVTPSGDILLNLDSELVLVKISNRKYVSHQVIANGLQNQGNSYQAICFCAKQDLELHILAALHQDSSQLVYIKENKGRFEQLSLEAFPSRLFSVEADSSSPGFFLASAYGAIYRFRPEDILSKA